MSSHVFSRRVFFRVYFFAYLLFISTPPHVVSFQMDPMDVDEGPGASIDSVHSSSEDEQDAGPLARGHGGRFRKRKMNRSGVAATAAAATATRKRGRKVEGGASGRGGGAAANVLNGEKLDFPSTVTPRTPYGIPLLLSCLSAYPDKVTQLRPRAAGGYGGWGWGGGRCFVCDKRVHILVLGQCGCSGDYFRGDRIVAVPVAWWQKKFAARVLSLGSETSRS